MDFCRKYLKMRNIKHNFPASMNKIFFSFLWGKSYSGQYFKMSFLKDYKQMIMSRYIKTWSSRDSSPRAWPWPWSPSSGSSAWERTGCSSPWWGPACPCWRGGQGRHCPHYNPCSGLPPPYRQSRVRTPEQYLSYSIHYKISPNNCFSVSKTYIGSLASL